MNLTNESQECQAIQALGNREHIREQHGIAREESGPDEDHAWAAGLWPGLEKDIRKKLSVWKKAALILLGIAVIGLLVGLIMPPYKQIHWVGGKDLDITFVVMDADNDQPLQDARVKILCEETSFSANRGKAPFEIATDTNGVVKQGCGDTMCFGTFGRDGWGRRIDTFFIHLPGWHIQVEAAGYTSLAPFYLDTREYQRQVKRGTTCASLKIPISLHKAEQPKPPTRMD